MFVGWKGKDSGADGDPSTEKRAGRPRWGSALDEGKLISLNAVVFN